MLVVKLCCGGGKRRRGGGSVAMAKVYKIANPQQPSASAPVAERDTNWDKCVLCQQEITDEVLQCPANSKRSTSGAGYKTLADNLLAFNEIGWLSSSIVSRLMEEQDLEGTFRSHKAKWHDSCRLQYNKTKLERATKRKASSSESSDAPKKFTHRTMLLL